MRSTLNLQLQLLGRVVPSWLRSTVGENGRYFCIASGGRHTLKFLNSTAAAFVAYGNFQLQHGDKRENDRNILLQRYIISTIFMSQARCVTDKLSEQVAIRRVKELKDHSSNVQKSNDLLYQNPQAES